MSSCKRQRPPEIKDWTKDDVRDWLISDVKVHPSYAEKFFEEDVCGEYLVDFTKTEILDLDIKHGPAVKITFHLKQWKEGSKVQVSKFPSYVHTWTKEQVNQWLLQYVKLYEKSAQRLREEEVSGDCLVCFEKQDFKDLDIKQGPAVKILAELGRLKDKTEPELQTGTSTEEEMKESDQPGPSVSQPEVSIIRQKKTLDTTMTYESPQVQTFPGSHEKPPQAPSVPNIETTAEVSGAASRDNSTTNIYNVLNDLNDEEMGKFCFHLRNYTSHTRKPIQKCKLQSETQRHIASLLRQHYVEDAPQVTVEILRMMNKNESALELEKLAVPLMSKHVQSKTFSPVESDQGEKLKDLLTCGGNTLENYDKFVVVLNKSHKGQVQHLNFLTKLKLFCVLDFDPNSVCPGGVCHSYRKKRIANLHSPSQYQGKTEDVMKNLNLHKQTSWVFCNGRNDLEDPSHQELDYKTWLKRSCRDVEQLVSIICKGDVLCHGEFLVVFLLLSPVETEKDPLFETYKCFYKNTSEKNIITLCDDKSIFSKWKKLIHQTCDTDIGPFSINELSLSEINGSILALGPVSRQSTVKLLPSSAHSSIVLKQKDEDLMTALDILCMNQCENIYDENSEQFKQVKLKQEEEFYRGGKVKWWNFYFCDKDKERPFIKRDKYDNVMTMIKSQLKNPQNTCVPLIFYHHPGCGATTLAMHVMWDLRKEIRCAVLKDNKASKEEVAQQVLKLMKLDNEKPCSVLLLVDDSRETDKTYELVNLIQKLMDDFHGPCKVVILNCVLSLSPREQYREHSGAPSQYLTASLTTQEQQDFEKKLKELEVTHTKPENFYTFMLMKSNFDPHYTHSLASNTLESFDFSTNQAKLFTFLALLNTYVTDSEIALSLCKDFLGRIQWQEDSVIRWQEDTVLKRMAPYSNLLIVERVKDSGEYNVVRILHNKIAAACLEELDKRCELKVSDITTELLDCDLFYRSDVVKTRLMMSIKRMLIERQRKKDGDEREPFSPLIERIHNQKGRTAIQDIFEKASNRFESSAPIPQAFARYLYINEKDFSAALKWAEKAKNITENPYTMDTIAQVYKSNLKHNMDREKHEKSHRPEDLEANLKIASHAITAFKKAQELAKTVRDAEEEQEDVQDYPRNSYTIYGYVGVVEMTFSVFDVLSRLPFFDESKDPMCKMYLKSFLEGNIRVTSVHKENSEVNERYVKVICENEHFLQYLKQEVKETFNVLQDFFTYLKPNNSEFDSKNRRTINAHFQKYVTLFCTEPEQVKKEQRSNPHLALKIEIEQQRLMLEMKMADTFSGILQHLERPVTEMEQITQAYAYLHKHKQFNSTIQANKDTTNYILSNIVLYLSNPNSKHVLSYKDLSDLLQNILPKNLHEAERLSKYPDVYYTALLLLWPGPSDETTDIQKYVTAIQRSSRKHLSYFRGRSTVAHLYLAKGSGLKRLVSKLQLDKNFMEKKSPNDKNSKGMTRNDLARLWRSGDIFKEKSIKDQLLRVRGTIEEGEVYAEYGRQKISVRPALVGTRSGFSTEKVSFFIGFAINGPLAYNIKNEN